MGSEMCIRDSVIIGKRCLIAAGSVVIEGTTIPDDTIVRGIPGKAIGRTLEKHKQLLERAAKFYREKIEVYKKSGL